MPNATLILRRANVSRKGGHWNDDDYDVFDGDASGASFWTPTTPGFGASIFRSPAARAMATRTLDEAKAAFRKEYLASASPPDAEPMTPGGPFSA